MMSDLKSLFNIVRGLAIIIVAVMSVVALIAAYNKGMGTVESDIELRYFIIFSLLEANLALSQMRDGQAERNNNDSD